MEFRVSCLEFRDERPRSLSVRSPLAAPPTKPTPVFVEIPINPAQCVRIVEISKKKTSRYVLSPSIKVEYWMGIEAEKRHLRATQFGVGVRVYDSGLSVSFLEYRVEDL